MESCRGAYSALLFEDKKAVGPVVRTCNEKESCEPIRQDRPKLNVRRLSLNVISRPL